MYTRYKLTCAKRMTISVGAIVEIEVKEEITIPKSESNTTNNYGKFYLRKSLAKRGLDQRVHTPFPDGWKGVPLIVVKNDDVAPIELREGDEIGEVFIYTQTPSNYFHLK